MADEEIGVITLNDKSDLVFSLGYWKGKTYAYVRKFVHSQKYEGPTKSGFAMDNDELAALVEVLNRLHRETPRVNDYEFSRIKKYKGKDIIISIVKPDDPMSLPSIDIREFVSFSEYTGPTKKGIRFLWDKLSQVIALLQLQYQRIAKDDERQQLLFPTPKQKPDNQTVEISEPSGKYSDAILAKICPKGIRNFPHDFVKNNCNVGKQLQLPSETINISTLIDGDYVVRSDLGFCCNVRNPVEGKFILYCWLRLHRFIQIPKEMIEIFKAVKEYENYLREIHHALIQEYERISGSRSIAEYQTKEVFKKHGLPQFWMSQ